jgi:uncharacterized protein DUF6869
MNRSWLKRFAQNWFSEWRPDPPIYGRASQLLVRRLEKNPDRAWRLILALIEHASDEDDLSTIGAGPLEDLLGTHGAAFIGFAEDRAKEDPRFLTALQNVWIVPEDPIYARLDAATYGRHCGQDGGA